MMFWNKKRLEKLPPSRPVAIERPAVQPTALQALVTLPSPATPIEPPFGVFPRGVSVGGRLNFNQTSAAARLLRSGWSAPEEWGVWSNGKSATLNMPIAEPVQGKALQLEFEVVPFLAPPTILVQLVSVSVNNVEVGSDAADNGAISIINIVIPKDVSASPVLEITFALPNAASPASVGVSPEQRILGIGLRSVRLVSAE